MAPTSIGINDKALDILKMDDQMYSQERRLTFSTSERHITSRLELKLFERMAPGSFPPYYMRLQLLVSFFHPLFLVYMEKNSHFVNKF